MNEDKAKFLLKFGRLEVEYEGNESFLINDLSNLMNKMVSFCKEHSATQLIDTSSISKEDVDSTDNDKIHDYSTTTIATRMNVTNAPELALAASAHLTIVKSQQPYTRADILTEMKGATSYYKKSMASNLNKNLESLVKNKRLNQTTKGTYALTANEKERIEQLLD